MGKINFITILEFLELYAGESYKKIDKVFDDEEKIRIANIKSEAEKMLVEWKKLYPYFSAKGYEYNNKSVSQWLNGSNTQVKSYLWLALKKFGYDKVSSSISIFAEKINNDVRFRVTIEIDDKNSTREDYIRHNRYLDKFGDEILNFNLFASVGNGLELKELRQDEIYDYIEAVKNRKERKVQVGKVYSKEKILELGSDNFLEELDRMVSLLEPYYNVCISDVKEGIYNKKVDVEIKENNKKLSIEILEKLEHIGLYINNSGYIYSFEDLSNFYLSLKTKPFVILAGISGTGKSKLVKLFAEAIGATSANGQYKLISVKPDWNDSTELLGYKNIKDEFIPGKLLEIIKEASIDENKDKPYFVCLDEMNLARVEYYLSEYLSIIESREFNENKEIVTDKIFSDSYFNENEFKGITLPENLYLIGTVNMDDTTFSFSRKVLDRANTIEFSEVDLETLDFIEESSEALSLDNSFLKTSFLNIKDALNIDREYVQGINSKIVEINNILKEHSKHFGYRVRDEIVFYMLENKLTNLLDEDTAFDYQIMQKVLPTIIGSDESIKDILIKLYNYCVEDFEINPDGDYVDEAKKNLHRAKYKISANKIYNMLRGYRDGYTSFWL